MTVWLVNVEEDMDTVYEYMEANEVTLPVLSDPDGSYYNGYHREPSPGPFPVDVIVGKDGRIIYLSSDYNSNDIRDAIDAELAR